MKILNKGCHRLCKCFMENFRTVCFDKLKVKIKKKYFSLKTEWITFWVNLLWPQYSRYWKRIKEYSLGNVRVYCVWISDNISISRFQWNSINGKKLSWKIYHWRIFSLQKSNKYMTEWKRLRNFESFVIKY